MPNAARPVAPASSGPLEVEKGEEAVEASPAEGLPENVAVPVDTAALMAALVAGTDQLLTALADFRRAPRPPERPVAEHDRLVATNMLIHLGTFADRAARLGIGPEPVPNLTGPLFELATALHALEQGKAVPMLIPIQADLGSALVLHTLSPRAKAAAALHILVDPSMGKMKLKEASAAVARAAAGTTIFVDPDRATARERTQATDAGAVRRWREEFMKPGERRTLDGLRGSRVSDRAWASSEFNTEIQEMGAVIRRAQLAPEQVHAFVMERLRLHFAPPPCEVSETALSSSGR